jgi:hypothetical protein
MPEIKMEGLSGIIGWSGEVGFFEELRLQVVADCGRGAGGLESDEGVEGGDRKRKAEET